MARTLAQLAQESLDVQDACNLAGVAQSFARAMVDLRALPEALDSDGIRNHPIARLWADKIAHLTDTQGYTTNVSRAYDAVYQIIAAARTDAA